MALEMQDTTLMAKLSAGDVIAIEAKYHLQCLTAYRNKYRSFLQQHKRQPDLFKERCKARAFAELVAHVDELLDAGNFLFKCFVLHNLYEQRLKEFGVDIAINKTRLKEKLLKHFSDMGLQEQYDGRNTVLLFLEGMQQVLKDAHLEALLLTKVARICRQEILSVDTTFSGSFAVDCQRDITPITNQLVSMILYGPNIKDKAGERQSCLTISQLLLFNSKKRGKPSSTQNRHSSEREPPLPLYIGLNLHSQTRSKTLVDNMAKLGISVSYDRVCQVENNLAVSVCQQSNADGIVCPSNLRKGIFTVGALDNIDHNPSSTTAEGSLHGTGISIMQFPTQENQGICREASYVEGNLAHSQQPTLPDIFTNVPAVTINNAIDVPQRSTAKFTGKVEQAKAQEKCWIERSLELLRLDKLQKGQLISWAAYHASRHLPVQDPCSIIALLPLFLQKADSPAMVKHGLDVLKCITEFLNVGQIPVLACDCPIFAICKKIQWCLPHTHGEDKILIIFGGLHIEKALWNALGSLLSGSGWTGALTEAGIVTSGTADSFLSASHITRTRHIHQVTALSLAKLQQNAFVRRNETSDVHDEKDFKTWREEIIAVSPTYRLRDLILRTELLILMFVSRKEKETFLYMWSVFKASCFCSLP